MKPGASELSILRHYMEESYTRVKCLLPEGEGAAPVVLTVEGQVAAGDLTYTYRGKGGAG